LTDSNVSGNCFTKDFVTPQAGRYSIPARERVHTRKSAKLSEATQTQGLRSRDKRTTAGKRKVFDL
jgi:hypothetical protein